MRVTELFEAFDSTYRIRQSGNNEFSFTTENGTVYQITFFVPSNIRMAMEYQQEYFPLVPSNPNSYAEVEFSITGADGNGVYKYLGGSEQVRDSGENSLKVFATVMNTVFWFVTTKRIEVLVFSGESKLGPLYERMIRRYIPNSYAMLKGTTKQPMRFMIYKKGMPLE